MRCGNDGNVSTYSAFTWANLVAQSAWTRLLRLYEVDVAALSETDVTRTILVDSHGSRNVRAVLSGAAGTLREAESGSDIEVYFVSNNRGFGWRVQAKRIFVGTTSARKCGYADINRFIGGGRSKKPRRRQTDQLIERAAEHGLGAWYWFYNTAIDGCGCSPTRMACGMIGGCVRCRHMSHDLVENGVMAAAAVSIRDRIGTRKTLLPVEEAMQDSFHLRCLVDDRTHAGRYPGEGVVRLLVDRLHGIERELHPSALVADDPVSSFTGLSLRDMQGDAVPLIFLPDQIASALDDGQSFRDRGQVDEYLRTRSLMGLIVFSFD